MPGQGLQWTDFLSCEVCYKLFSENVNRPISLGCGHTVCKLCLSKLQQSKCPFDQSPISCDIDKLPVNYALLQLIGAAIPDRVIGEEVTVGDVLDSNKTECYESARKCIEELAVYLKPLSEDSVNELEKNNDDLTDLKASKSGYQQPLIQMRGGRTVSTPPTHNAGCVLSRPMQRKLLVLINCQLVEEEGRSRAARAARSLGERSVTELILAHQNPQQLSANLWAAVRTRGCQFLGPGMQEEVLRLILLALEDGSALSRKVLVLFVVQRLEKQYPQASKTAIGHVVQLLYRASCFKVTKREEESSLMQLKEEFRGYDALRLEHDAQIVQIAMEAGLRISPEQWSSLLYGDATHKSHMQSIIDKHQSPQSFTQGISELVLVLQRLGDPSNLCRLRPHLDFLAKIDPSPDCPAPSWEDLEAVMKSLKIVVQGLVDFVRRFNHRRPEMAPPQNTRYKTSMCRDFTAKGSCPRGASCTFAHSQEELEQYRCRSKKLSQRGGATAGSAVMAFNPRPKSEMEQADDPAQHKQDGEMGEGDGCAGALEAPMADLTVGPRAQNLAHPDPVVTAGAVQFPTRPDPVVTAGTTQFPPPVFSDPVVSGGAAQLPPAHSDPVPPQPTTQFPHPVSAQPPGPSPMFPVMQQGVAMPRPSAPRPFRAPANVSEGARGDQLPGTFPQGMGVRFPVPSELGVPYHKSSLAPSIPQSLPGASISPINRPPHMAAAPTQTHSHTRPHSHPHPHPHPHLPARVPEMLGPSASCVHQVPSEVLHPGVASVYPVVGGAVPPYPPEAYMFSPVGDMQPAMGGAPLPPLQTLEKLQNRKSKLISHLQVESVGPGPGPLGRSNLDRLLSTRPRPALDSLSSSVNDTFVAMRTTNTLDELSEKPDGLKPHHHEKGGHMNGNSFSMYLPPKSAALLRGGVDHEAFICSSMSSAPQTHQACAVSRATTVQSCRMQASGKYQVFMSAEGGSATYLDITEDGDSKDMDYLASEVMGIVAVTLEDEDVFIPFDPPLVSKFGPICRCARIKGRNTAPVQVTAEKNTCTPVLSVTPLHRPYPTTAPVPSLYKPQMTSCPAPSSSISSPRENSPTTIYSPWSGLDIWRCKIPELVQNLEESAIQANTASERLALQLQSVELQISMKTGKSPKLVCQLLQEASPGDKEQRKPSTQSLGNMYSSGEESYQLQHRESLSSSEWK